MTTFISIGRSVVVWCVLANVVLTQSGPQNVVIVAGETARFNCSTANPNDGSTIFWNFNLVTSIYSNCTSLRPTSLTSVYGAQSCDVIVLPDGVSVAGSYSCANGQPKEALAYLVVLTAQPTCVSNPSPIIEGQPYILQCGGNFTFGRYNILNPPLSAWTTCVGLGSTPTVQYTSPAVSTNPVVFQLPTTNFTINTTQGVNIPTYDCDVHFSFVDNPADPDHVFALNSVSYKISSQNMTVSYCPRNLSITPVKTQYIGGDVLTCWTDSSPSPSYQWTDANSAVVSTGPTLTLPDTGGKLNFTCTVIAAGAMPCSNLTMAISLDVLPKPNTNGNGTDNATSAGNGTNGNGTNTGGNGGGNGGNGTGGNNSGGGGILGTKIGVPVAFGVLALTALTTCCCCIAAAYRRRRKYEDEWQENSRVAPQLKPIRRVTGFTPWPRYNNGRYINM